MDAQVYYAIHPEAQPIIDPNSDGRACEVWFGVDEPPPAPPPPAPPQPPSAPDSDHGNGGAGSGPVRTGFGGLDGVDFDCYDFASSAEAQAYFEGDGGSAANNADGLDRDHDGLACEAGEFD